MKETAIQAEPQAAVPPQCNAVAVSPFAQAVLGELNAAREKYGPVNSPEEAYGILARQLGQFFCHVQRTKAGRRHKPTLLKQLRQLGAMAQRAAEDLDTIPATDADAERQLSHYHAQEAELKEARGKLADYGSTITTLCVLLAHEAKQLTTAQVCQATGDNALECALLRQDAINRGVKEWDQSFKTSDHSRSNEVGPAAGAQGSTTAYGYKVTKFDGTGESPREEGADEEGPGDRDWPAEVERLEKELDREKARTAAIMDGVGLSGPLLAVAVLFARALRSGEAKSCAAADLTHPTLGPITVTLQRKDGIGLGEAINRLNVALACLNGVPFGRAAQALRMNATELLEFKRDAARRGREYVERREAERAKAQRSAFTSGAPGVPTEKARP